MRRFFRVIALLLILIALLLVARDGYATYQAHGLRIMDAGTFWAGMHKESLDRAGPMISEHMHPMLWDPVLTTILMLPAWLVFLVLGLLLWILTRMRSRPASRDLFMRH